MVNWLKKKIKIKLRNFLLSIMREEVDELAKITTIVEQVQSWKKSSRKERQNYYEKTRNPLVLKDRLMAANVSVEDASIDIEDFEGWRTQFRELDQFYSGFVGNVEKCLEHYLVYKWLGLSEQDTYIDVGAAKSMWVDILNARGYRAYRLDLIYEKGIHGYNIGADAGDTQLPDGFASVMSLQCAYETFRGDADVRFVREAGRVLGEKGRFAILPLYVDENYFIMSSPYLDLSGFTTDEGSMRVWREDSNKEAFSRHYSPEAFAERIYAKVKNMRAKVVHFDNLDEVRSRYPAQSIYCHFMFLAEK